jgi:hypothetical protein
MSRTSAFLLLLLLLAAAGIVWVLFAGGDALRDEIAPEALDPTDLAVPPPLVDERGPGLAGSRDAGDVTRRRKPLWPVLPTDRIPRGAIEVRPVYEDETPVAVNDARVRLDREGSTFYAQPGGVPDYDTGIWRFDEVVVGWLQVVVVGDYVLEATARAQVSKGQTEEVTVVVRRAGAIAYEAELYSGERPELITLELRHPETKKALDVYWEVRAPDAYASARKATRVVQGPEGVVFPIPPGRWILHATSAAGEIDQVDLEIRAGETARASIKLRR